MKKQLLNIGVAFAATLLLAGGALAQHEAPVRVENLPYVAPGTITIDGVADEDGWSPNSAITEMFNSTGIENAADFSGYIKFCFDQTNLYIFSDVQDGQAVIFPDGSTNTYENDNLEIFLNADTLPLTSGSYGTAETLDAIQYRYNRGIDTCTNGFGRNSTDMTVFTTIDGGSSWQVEAQIPWLSFMPEGTLPEDVWTILKKGGPLGFDASIADNDGSGRDGQGAWDADVEGDGATEDLAWNNTTNFGVLMIENATFISSLNSTSANNFEIYPNPASNNVTFKNLSGVTSLEIVNLVGQSVKTVEVNNETVVVNVADLATGNYFVKLQTNVGIVTEKLIVR